MSKSTFYIVTPSYNQGVFITQTLESILSQKDVEVISIVQDGGSNDQTVSVLKKFGRKITWVSKKDKGQSDALNQGLKKVIALSKNPDTDFFAYLNSDDYYLSGAFKAVAEYFKAHPQKQWVVGDCQIVNQDSQEVQSLVRLYKTFWRSFLAFPTLLVLNPIPQPAVFMKVSAAKDCGLFKESLRYTMDYEYWLRLWKQVGAPGLISRPLAAFRIHALSKGGSQFSAQFDEELRVAQTYTQQPLLVWGHKLHNALITGIYSVIK